MNESTNSFFPHTLHVNSQRGAKSTILSVSACIFLLLFAIISGMARADTYGDLTYTITGETVTIIDCVYSVSAVAIPSQINGLPVTSIGNNAFAFCTSLTNVTIPDSVTSIGSWAFYRCLSLASINIPENVSFIGSWAFGSCQSLRTVTIPGSVMQLESGVFALCTNLEAINVDLTNAVYSSQSGVLFNKSQTEIMTYPCGRVSSYTLPDSVISIGNFSFSNCGRLSEVTLPGSVLSIGEGAFNN